jgi:tetratricopeptide (TPR) repeat protein
MPDRPASRAALVACAVAIAALVAVIYAPLRDHEYLDYDDMAYLVWNPDVAPSSLGGALANAFSKPLASGWVPLTALTHQLDRALWGNDASGPLLENALLHALGSLLLLAALHRLTGRLAASAFVAAVHAVHPLHVESVAWAIERKDVLSGVFFSALLWSHARYCESPTTGRRAAALACLALGLLSKPMLVTAPFALLLLDAWPLRRLSRSAVLEKWPMFAMVLLVSLATLYFQSSSGAMQYGERFPFEYRVGNAIVAAATYLRAAVWPAQLSAYYPHPGRLLGVRRLAAAALVLAAATAAALGLRRRAPWLLVGWLWYLGMLVPVLGLVQVGMQGRADRYTYLPLIGISLALAFMVDAFARTALQRRAAAAIGVAWIAALSVAAIHQVPYWRDSRALYERMRSVNPQSAYPELRLGMVEAFDGRFDRAMPHLDRVHELRPGYDRAVLEQLSQMARFHAAQGHTDQALRTAGFAISFAERTGQPEQASEIRAFERSLQGVFGGAEDNPIEPSD